MNNNQNNQNNQALKSNNDILIMDNIVFYDILKKIIKNISFLIKVSILFLLIGIIYATFQHNYYIANCSLLPQSNQKQSNSGLGGLAAMAGINIGSINSSEIISPTIYYRILNNIDFQKELVYSKIKFLSKEDSTSLIEYLNQSKIVTKESGQHLIKEISLNQIDDSSNNLKTYTNNEKLAISKLKSTLFLTLNNKEGIVTLSVRMEDPLAAATLAQKSQELLQKFITKFKIEKVSRDLAFVEKSYLEAKTKFEEKQNELANFRDANRNLTSSLAKTHEEKLVSEYNLLLSIYSELAKQKEQARISVTETTPVLTIINPIVVPLDKTGPNRFLIVAVYFIFGIFIGIILIFVIPIFKLSSSSILLIRKLNPIIK